MSKTNLNNVNSMKYTACTVVLFTNKEGDLVKGAAPWRDEKGVLHVTTTPRRFDRRQAHSIDDAAIISFFEVDTLSDVDEILETNLQPRTPQRKPLK